MSDPTPDSVRAAILRAADIIASVQENVPHKVSTRLSFVDFKLRAAMWAVGEWDAMLKREAIEQKEQISE